MLISVAKFFFDSDFPSPYFDVPKASNVTSGGVQNHETKNRGLGTIVTSIQDSKPREKQISQSILLLIFKESFRGKSSRVLRGKYQTLFESTVDPQPLKNILLRIPLGAHFLLISRIFFA